MSGNSNGGMRTVVNITKTCNHGKSLKEDCLACKKVFDAEDNLRKRLAMAEEANAIANKMIGDVSDELGGIINDKAVTIQTQRARIEELEKTLEKISDEPTADERQPEPMEPQVGLAYMNQQGGIIFLTYLDTREGK